MPLLSHNDQNSEGSMVVMGDSQFFPLLSTPTMGIAINMEVVRGRREVI